MAKLTDTALLAIVSKKVQESDNFFKGKLTSDRIKATRYYNRQPFGWEQVGRSKYVSGDVFETVENLMPDLMRVFTSDNQAGYFEPQGPEDELRMQQATDTVNYVWYRQNDGFSIIHDSLKDGLLNKFGILKIWYDHSKTVTSEHACGLTFEQVVALNASPEVELHDDGLRMYEDEDAKAVLEAKYAEVIQQIPPGYPLPPKPAVPDLYDVDYTRTKSNQGIRVAVVPPEEFLFPSMSTDLDSASALTHRKLMTATELRQLGLSKAEIEDLPGENDRDNTYEKRSRHEPTESTTYADSAADSSMKMIWVNETYIKLDYDGDGVAEFRKVMTAGTNGATLIDNEEVDSHPFIIWSPIKMPHKAIGMSMADTVMDVQEVNSTLIRLGLDSLYHTVSPRILAGPGVQPHQIDALLSPAPGQVISVGSIADVKTLDQQPMAAPVMSMVEYFNQIKSQRTGQTPYNQGLDADTLNNHTAQGMRMIRSAGQDRTELIARLYAETLLKPAFKRIYQLLRQHQDKGMTIRLRNEWVDVNPTDWSEETDFTVSVGLGTGDREIEKQNYSALLSLYERVINMQGGVQGPLVNTTNVFNAASKLVTSMGLKTPELYFMDPSKAPAQPQQGAKPDPMAEAIKMKATADMEVERMKAQNKITIDRERHQFEMEIAREKATLEAELEIYKVRTKAQLEQQDAENDLKMETARTLHDMATAPIPHSQPTFNKAA